MSKRIFIFNVNWLGDVLFSTALLRALRTAYPDSFIACAIPPRCREILELNPDLDEIIIYDEKLAHSSVLGKLRFVSELKKRKFDTAFLLHRSLTRALITYLAGIRERIGYHTKKRAFFLTKAIEPDKGEVHRADYFLGLAKAMGIKDATRSYRFFIKEDDRGYIKKLLAAKGIKENDRVAVINAGGNWEPKRWPKENFVELADDLIKEFGLKIIISGEAKDEGLGEFIVSLMKKDAVILCGETNLKQLAALMERANLVVSGDTGPMHIAAAMGAPTIALFGPTSPRVTGPRNSGKFAVIWKIEKCKVPCYDLSCTDNECMKRIKVADVMAEARKMLRG
ncbi:MAG: lipopolysaccharide heptosyltransferase II [Candidatus Omnitrophica bacterium CG07_land_8_20_14_0_80_42_15]|uniref:lipopolysaccharide heptosyltransferase II n=1 Tax=Candidatus Aquitaenariimonas noxiae TaxID=1974741 RepID=A0A2J0KVG1_9BACT|nr:MAG: lipopolysaccharide heptosyltransferase II [Candidatus Omnitrophica bacterium CG07_land_8_20_14_0_80_42_15]